MGNPKITWNLLVLALQIGCIEPFEFETSGAGKFLVVDGLISDQPGPYEINLSWSIPLVEDSFRPAANVLVSIEEENGIAEQLSEESEGRYVTSRTGIQGKAGRRYRMNVTLNKGVKYQSSWALLKSSPPIDSIYWRFEDGISSNDEIIEGIQLYVDTHDPENQTMFYRYELDETWRFSVPFATKLEYVGNFESRPRDQKRFCWLNYSSGNINITSSSMNTSDLISEHPLKFISTETNELRIRYSVLATQFAMNRDEYNFWKALQENSEESGNLFDKQPQTISSNLANLTNPDEPALGYFLVSGISTHRIYIDVQDLPEGTRVKSFADECALVKILASLPGAEEKLLTAIRNGNLFYDIGGGFGIPLTLDYTTPECGDCTASGGLLTPPKFWVD